MNFTEDQKNFLLELVEKEIEHSKKIRMLKFSGGGFEKERFKPNKLSQFDTPTSAAFKRFAEKLKKELSNE
jgi:hypothetical protein